MSDVSRVKSCPRIRALYARTPGIGLAGPGFGARSSTVAVRLGRDSRFSDDSTPNCQRACQSVEYFDLTSSTIHYSRPDPNHGLNNHCISYLRQREEHPTFGVAYVGRTARSRMRYNHLSSSTDHRNTHPAHHSCCPPPLDGERVARITAGLSSTPYS